MVLGGIAVWDVASLLPRRGDGYPERPLDAISHLFIHHSGRLGRPGFAGLLASTEYVTKKRNFPGCAYHLWAPFDDCRDGEGRLVCFRANARTTRSWHTGGPLNGFGESLALQGNTSREPMSPTQIEILEAVLPYELEQLAIGQGLGDGDVAQLVLSWHSEASRSGGKDKPACPGADAVRWLTAYRPASDWLEPSVVSS